jgi:ParB family chromosome partitioning protein
MTDYVHITRIEPHPANIRADVGDVGELAASMRVQGILQPLVVQPHPARRGAYQLLAGHRRLAAAELARIEEIPITIRRLPRQADAAVVMLVENCQRSDLGPVEKAEAMGRLRDVSGYTARAIAQATGLSVSTVSYYLSLLDLDEASRARVASGTVQVGEAIAAVRTSRAVTRRRNGHAPRPKVTVEAGHFSYRHPLADAARVMCELAGHTGPKVGRGRAGAGKVACGSCWETAIRDDERQSARAQGAAVRGPALAGTRREGSQ